MEIAKSLCSLMLKSAQTNFFLNFPFLDIKVDFFSEKSKKTSSSCFTNMGVKILFKKIPTTTIKQTPPPTKTKQTHPQPHTKMGLLNDSG